MQAVPSELSQAPIDLEKHRLVQALLDLLVASDPYGVGDAELESARHEARVLLQRQFGGYARPLSRAARHLSPSCPGASKGSESL